MPNGPRGASDGSGTALKDLTDLKKIAVLVDADNAQHSVLKSILDELSKHGHVLAKKAYGDWSQPNLKNWPEVLNQLAITPVQQFALTRGKNSTDVAMVIDAMDLFYSGRFDAFALVSSDSDFTRLASRLREGQMYVFGFGQEKTPESFRNACDDFIYVEYLEGGKGTSRNRRGGAAKKKAAAKNPDARTGDEQDVILLLETANDDYANDDGWALVSNAAAVIKRQRPDFSSRMFDCKKFMDVILYFGDLFEVKKIPWGEGEEWAYRPKG